MAVTWWVAIDPKGNDVQIESACSDVEYTCPSCDSPMIARKGDVRQWHFAHKPLDDGTERVCSGGEGYRHYRVKTFLYNLMDEVRRKEFFFDFELKIERVQDGDIPDISLEFPDNESIFAIEIVDTNPPSKEKRERWKDRMFQIPIMGWSDAQISNASRLAGLLVPTIIRFQNLMVQVRDVETEFDEVMNELNKGHEDRLAEIKEKQAKKMQRLTTRYEKKLGKRELELMKEVDELSIDDKKPWVWVGNFSNLGDDEWGLSIKYEYHRAPKTGDFCLAITKAKNIEYCRLAEKVEGKFSEYNESGWAKFRIDHREKSDLFNQISQKIQQDE